MTLRIWDIFIFFMKQKDVFRIILASRGGAKKVYINNELKADWEYVLRIVTYFYMLPDIFIYE